MPGDSRDIRTFFHNSTVNEASIGSKVLQLPIQNGGTP